MIISVIDENNKPIEVSWTGNDIKEINIKDICISPLGVTYIITSYDIPPFGVPKNIKVMNQLEALKIYNYINLEGPCTIKEIETHLMEIGLKIVML